MKHAVAAVLMVFLLPPSQLAAQTGHDHGPAASAGEEAEAHPGAPTQEVAGAHGAHGPHLERLSPEEADRLYHVELSSEPERPTAGQRAVFTFALADAGGLPVTDLQVSHERLLHILVADSSLGDFQHLHIEESGVPGDEALHTGRFSLPITFTTGGLHRVSVEFAHRGRGLSRSFAVDVQGRPPGRTRWNYSSSRKVGDLKVILRPDAYPVRRGTPVLFTVNVTAGNEPVHDLEPYLGAAMHVAVWGEGASSLAHNHGEASSSSAGTAAGGHGAGTFLAPPITFSHVFPTDGRFRLFLQFQRAGKPVTASFDLDVEGFRNDP